MIKNILFPVDFSPSCVAVAPYVKRAKAIFGANVTLVHVCDLASHNGFELYARAADDIAEEHWNLARSRLEVFLESEFPAKESPRILLAGDAARAITETAKKSKCDLIMMPTHAGRFRRMLFGSTTAKVLSDANSPVLTTQHAAAIAPRSLEHRKWVCAVGLSSDSERVLRYARDAALAAGARLSVIHAIQTSVAESKTQRPSEMELQARQHIAELLSALSSDALVSIVVGPVREVLLDAVRKSSADVLVLGRSTHSGALGRMRDLTYSLIRDSPCPVVSV
jgi:nucleotide-binding universal stress UspA family protein